MRKFELLIIAMATILVVGCVGGCFAGNVKDYTDISYSSDSETTDGDEEPSTDAGAALPNDTTTADDTETADAAPYSDSNTPNTTASVIDEIAVNYTPSPDYGYVIPFLARHIEDEFIPENDEYLYGLTDINGNIICEPVFDKVAYIKACNVYILSATENGVTRYGLLSADGMTFTGLKYDGAAYDMGIYEDEGGHFYTTIYSVGELTVTQYSEDLEVTDNDIVITIDEQQLPFDAVASGMSVCHMGDGSAIVENSNEFYPKRLLLDISTGDVLCDISDYFIGNRVFGDLIIQSGIRNGVTIYGMNGNVIYDNEDAWGGSVTRYRYAVAGDGVLEVYDPSGAVVASMQIDPESTVDSACGVIAVSKDGITALYDRDLNLVLDNIISDISDGYCVNDHLDMGIDDMYFVSFGDQRTLTDLNTGASISAKNGYHYSYYCGYIYADNRSDGNNPNKHWYLYDCDLNMVLEGEGTGTSIIRDGITGEAYLIASDDKSTMIRSLDTGEEVVSFDISYGRYVSSAYNGVFYVTNREQCFLIGSDGNEIFSFNIAS